MAMSSKRAGAVAGRELTIFLLRLLLKHTLEPDDFEEFKRHFPVPHALRDHTRLTRKLRDMERQKYIVRRDGKYHPASRGKRMLSENEIWELKISASTRWNRKWYIVLFDIPTRKKKQRDILRLRMKELGLMLYQDSVWIYPYPVETVISKIAHFYYIAEYVSFSTTEKITGEKRLKKHFGLA